MPNSNNEHLQSEVQQLAQQSTKQVQYGQGAARLIYILIMPSTVSDDRSYVDSPAPALPSKGVISQAQVAADLMHSKPTGSWPKQ